MEMRKVHVHVHECFKAGDVLKVEYMYSQNAPSCHSCYKTGYTLFLKAQLFSMIRESCCIVHCNRSTLTFTVKSEQITTAKQNS